MSAPAAPLARRESDLLARVAEGETYVEIARAWVVAETTVRHAGFRVMRKLGARTITHAVHLAHLAGLLESRPERHGDHPGYMRHVRAGEEPCGACRVGERAYRKELRAARKAPKVDAA